VTRGRRADHRAEPRPDTAANALFFYWPQVLPGAKKILLTTYPLSGEPTIGVLDIATGKVTVIAAGVVGRYSPSGHILLVQDDGALQAARFDAARGTVRGGFTTLAEGLYIGAPNNSPLTLSDEGTSVYQVTPPGGHVVRVFRDGGREEILDPEWTGEFGPLSLSPDGSRLAISVARGGRSELWVKALDTGAFTKLSAGGTANYRPSWSPDGREVVFTSDRRGKIASYHVSADGGAPPASLFSVERTVDEAGYSRDGQWLVFRGGSGGGRDIYAMRSGIASSVRAVVATPAEEFSPALSPNGRWLAYASDESGRTEVYVRPFPDGTARYTVSHNGGSEPLWSHSGKELFFRDGAENLVAVEVAPGDAFRPSAGRPLFSTQPYVADNRHHHYTVSLDDRSFFFVKSPSATASTNRLIVTLNLFEELRRKVGK
jgi:serine/threonine-protein kinase